MLRETAKNLRATPQASFSLLNVEVHSITIEHFFLSLISNVEMFGTAQCFAKKTKKQAAYQHKYLIPTVKHNSSEVVIWACFAPCRTAKA